jgi:hypothetical protein
VGGGRTKGMCPAASTMLRVTEISSGFNLVIIIKMDNNITVISDVIKQYTVHK